MFANSVIKICDKKILKIFCHSDNMITQSSHFEAGITKFSRRQSATMTSFTEHA